MRRPVPVFLPAIAVLLLVAACSSATQPAGGEAGRYVASTVRGRALPVVVDSSAQAYGVLHADTLDLDGHGGARRSLAIHRVDTSTRLDTVYRFETGMQYRLAGRRMELGRLTPCPPNALCVPNDTGVLTAGLLTLVTYQYAFGAQVVLLRVTQ